MNKIMELLRRLFGIEDSVTDDPFAQRPHKNLIRVKVAFGASIIAGLAIVMISIFSVAVSTAGSHVDVPVDLTASPSAQVELNSSVLGTVLIHVVGEVNSPGMYELEQGSRVIDAVMAAGGMSSSAAECGVNLAREINDGEQLVIPSQLQGCTSAQQGTSGSPISLNQATTEQFDSLPGIGPTLAERIVQWRESNGGFSSIEQLNDVSGIGDKLFAGIAELVSL